MSPKNYLVKSLFFMETLIQILIFFLKMWICGTMWKHRSPFGPYVFNIHKSTFFHKSPNQHSQITKCQNMKICWIQGSLRKSPNFLHLVLSEPSPVLGGYPVWWVKDQCWVLLWDSICFLLVISDRLYKYITSGSHFLKPLPSELNWKIIFLWYPPLAPTWKHVLKSKNLAKNRERTAGSFMKTRRFF